MRITVRFQFIDQQYPIAVTGVAGAVSDLILPGVGDTVTHCDDGGRAFMGRVTEKMYSYDLMDGIDVDGSVTVLVSMSRISEQ